MAAHLAPKFDYRPLGDDYGNFRLLELQSAIDRRDLLRCTIQHASIDTSAYCALSYVWGDQKADSSEMEITYKRPKRRLFESKKHYQEGAVVYRKEIGSSLARALRYMRQPHACVVIWVDAFCIDQESKDERASQVKLMTKIYSSAQVVHAWLGPEYNEDPAVTPAEDLQQRKNAVHQVWASFSAQLLQAVISHAQAGQIYNTLDSLSQVNYFSRMWILQETGRAKRVVFHYGERQASHQQLLLALGVTRAYNGSFAKDQLRMLGSKFDSRFLSCVIARLTCSKALGLHEVLKLAFFDRSTHSATDPRDLVYALLGLATNPQAIRVSYELSLDEVYIATARFLFGQGFTDSLITFRPYARSNEFLSPEFPSWAYDWSRRGLPSFARFKAAKDTRPRLSFVRHTGTVHNIAMSLKGTWIGRVSAVNDHKFSALASAAGLSLEVIQSGRLQGGARPLTIDEKRILGDLLARVHSTVQWLSGDVEKLMSQTALPLGNFWCWWVWWTLSIWSLAKGNTNEVAELLLREAPPRVSSNKDVMRLVGARDVAGLMDLQSWSNLLFTSSTAAAPGSQLTAFGIDIVESLFRSAWGTRPFVLDTGFLAGAAEVVQVRDEVVIFHGVKAPLVVRRAGNGAHKIVGPAHVCGAMQGQLMSDTSSVDTYTLI
ncbi:hypothetical protein LTR32_003943 [Rachicladosporium monterosium]|uniref:Heterokaryon incompatibility domain-containing protein n=1 Tax=Rachicladosporium monterosium TaxID=1507873 RepID=A0ABR0L5Z5_9PEZI|nr:hypothetical protein LTR32_003943 [Rachicladosporium monterosium]